MRCGVDRDAALTVVPHSGTSPHLALAALCPLLGSAPKHVARDVQDHDAGNEERGQDLARRQRIADDPAAQDAVDHFQRKHQPHDGGGQHPQARGIERVGQTRAQEAENQGVYPAFGVHRGPGFFDHEQRQGNGAQHLQGAQQDRRFVLHPNPVAQHEHRENGEREHRIGDTGNQIGMIHASAAAEDQEPHRAEAHGDHGAPRESLFQHQSGGTRHEQRFDADHGAAQHDAQQFDRPEKGEPVNAQDEAETQKQQADAGTGKTLAGTEQPDQNQDQATDRDAIGGRVPRREAGHFRKDGGQAHEQDGDVCRKQGAGFAHGALGRRDRPGGSALRLAVGDPGRMVGSDADVGHGAQDTLPQ